MDVAHSAPSEIALMTEALNGYSQRIRDHIEREKDAFRAEMTQIVAWAAEGRVKPHIHAVRPLAETAAAIEEIAARRVKGKIVVTA